MKIEEIGKDVAIRWTVYVNGETRDLRDLDLSLVLVSPGGTERVLPFTIKGDNHNEVWAKFYGTQQKYVGLYTLILYANRGRKGQSKLSACNFLKLVPECKC